MFGTSTLEAQKQEKPSETTGTSGTSTSSGNWWETPTVENLPTGYTRITNWSYVEYYSVGGVTGSLRNKRINVETELAVSSIHDGANSAFWIFKPIPNTDFYRIENMWKQGQVLYHTITPSTNATTADVLFGQVALDDPRAQWKLENGPENRPNTFKIQVANPAGYGHKLVVSDGKLKVSQSINNYYHWELSTRPNEVPPPIERDPLIPTELVRIEKGSMRINVETDLAISAIHDGAWSAMWNLVPIDGEPFYRIENKWKKNGQALNVTNHTLQFSAVSQDSHSGQWEIKRGSNEGEFYLKSRDGFTIYKSGSTINVYQSGHYPPKYSTTTWTLNKV
jgi:hypothetical protein